MIRGNEMARGKYVGWVDGDDILVNDALAKTVEFLEEHAAVLMVYTDYVFIDEWNRVVGPSRQTLPYSRENLLLDFMTFHFRLFRREAWALTGGIDPSLTMAPDWDFCLKVSEVGSIEKINEVLYCYRLHGGSVSQTRRLEQIENSEKAVRNALKRRGMEGKFELVVKVFERFQLIETVRKA